MTPNKCEKDVDTWIDELLKDTLHHEYDCTCKKCEEYYAYWGSRVDINVNVYDDDE